MISPTPSRSRIPELAFLIYGAVAMIFATYALANLLVDGAAAVIAWLQLAVTIVRWP